MEKYIVDRFEEDFVVLEKKSGESFDVKKTLLPDAKPGDVVFERDGVFFVDREATLERKAVISEKHRKLFGKKLFQVDKTL